MKCVVIAHHYHERLLCAVDRKGVVTTRLQGILNPPGQDHAIDWTMEMSDPFALLYHDICTMHLSPEVVVEQFPCSPTGYRMMAISTIEDVDWISALFHNPPCFVPLARFVIFPSRMKANCWWCNPNTYALPRMVH